MPFTRILSLVAAVLALSPAAAIAAPGALAFAPSGLAACAASTEPLGRGEVVYLEQAPFDGKGVALTMCATIDEKPREVWPVLRDCAAYQRFLPGVASSRLESRDDNIARCEAVIRLPFPLGEWLSLERATESERADGGFERRWSLESGTYRRMEGLWTLLPWGDGGRQTLLVYQLDMDPDTLVPDFLLRRAQSATAPDVFAAIRRRVRLCNRADRPC
jgi:ribosome-associated toxin RatA of RatAB toxin-antitoxin module